MTDIQGDPVSPRAWREEQELSLSQLAVLIGLRGKNVRTTYHKYERGENSAPLEVIAKIDTMSAGRVTYLSWLAVRRAWLAAHPKREKIAA